MPISQFDRETGRLRRQFHRGTLSHADGEPTYTCRIDEVTGDYVESWKGLESLGGSGDYELRTHMNGKQSSSITEARFVGGSGRTFGWFGDGGGMVVSDPKEESSPATTSPSSTVQTQGVPASNATQSQASSKGFKGPTSDSNEGAIEARSSLAQTDLPLPPGKLCYDQSELPEGGFSMTIGPKGVSIFRPDGTLVEPAE